MVCEASCAMDNRNKDMTERQENNNEKRSMPLERGNFTGMAIACAMIVLGFVLMLGSSSTADAFNPDIFSTRRIIVGPIIAFIGFVLMAIAIIIDPEKLPWSRKK